MAKRAAYGSGSIRKKEIVKNGKKYVYWEGRYSAGYDPGTGKLIQKSISGKTQKEVAQKLKEITLSIDKGNYTEPSKMTLNQWIEQWQSEYMVGYSPQTVVKYKSDIKCHIKPKIGALQLQDIEPVKIQRFLNGLSSSLSPKSIKNVHGLLHKILEEAMINGYISRNPADHVKLPKRKKPDLQCFEPEQVTAFLKASEEDTFKNLFILAIFTGMRRGEILGLTWDCVDFESNTIHIKHQLQRNGGTWELVVPKEDKTRSIIAAQIVMDALHDEQNSQEQAKAEYSDYFCNPNNLVFTSVIGSPALPCKVVRHFKDILEKAHLPEIRFHDLRHTFAVNSLQAGDDIKTLQDNLGHATAAFTLDTYSQTVNAMKRNSADRMQAFYEEKLMPKDDKK